jgi:hypothetical protein
VTPKSQQPAVDVVLGFITATTADVVVCVATPRDKVLLDLTVLTEIAMTLENLGDTAIRSQYYQKVLDAVQSGGYVTLVSLDAENATFCRDTYGLPAHLLVIMDDGTASIYDHTMQSLLMARACGFAHVALPIFPPSPDVHQAHGLMPIEHVLSTMQSAIKTFMLSEPGSVEHITVVAPNYLHPDLDHLLEDVQIVLNS